MKVVILHSQLSDTPGPDEMDTLIQVETVGQALQELGITPYRLPFSLDISAVKQALRSFQPDFVFNLVEAVEGDGSALFLAPLVLDELSIPYTGSRALGLQLTTNKVMTKKMLASVGIPTAAYYPFLGTGVRLPANLAPGQYILKATSEDASIGIDESSVVSVENGKELGEKLAHYAAKTGRTCFAEKFIQGREFNVATLAPVHREQISAPSEITGEGEISLESKEITTYESVLPPAEIEFNEYPEGKLRIVGYQAKWDSQSFEYHHTPQSFEFADREPELVERLESLTSRCVELFDLRDYARVDFRLDEDGGLFVLEVNANPCVAPDSGYVAAAHRADLSYTEMVERIVARAKREAENRLSL